jgi:uncharacterized protein YlaN (UPF0358 family)
MSYTDKLEFIPADTRKLLFREIFYANPFQGAAMLLKRDFAKECLPIPETVRYHDTWIATCACLADGLVYTYTPVIRYRHHGTNITSLDNHREQELSLWKKYCNYIDKTIKTLLRKYQLKTSRFEMVERLQQIYGLSTNIDFINICLFLEHAKIQKLTWKDIVFLWKNMEYITTSYSKISFLYYWFFTSLFVFFYHHFRHLLHLKKLL